MCSIRTIISVSLIITATQAGFINEITKGDVITKDTAIAHDVFVNNGTIKCNRTEKTKDEGMSAYVIVFRFFSLIVGGIAVFTLIQVLMFCCHDNPYISFQRKRRKEPLPIVIFLHKLKKDESDTKYKSIEFIDVEPLNGTKDLPMMSPTKQ